MRITKLSAANFKGQTFEHELAPVTLFCGPNFAGKSARVEALILALAGYLPGIPKKPNEIFDCLASGNPLEVQARSESDNPFLRKWKQENGAVRHSSMGRDIPPVAIDANEYLSLSDAERVKFLFSVATLPAGYSVDGLTRRLLSEVKNIQLEENTTVTEKAILSVCGVVSTSGLETDSKASVQEWLQALASLVKERKLVAEATVRRLSQTSQGLTQIAGDQTPAPPDAETRLTNAKSLLRTADETYTRQETQLSKCRKEYLEASATVKLATDLPKLKATLAEFEERKQKMRCVAKPEAQEPLLHAEREAREVKLRFEGVVEATNEAISTLEEQIEKASHARVCPTCGQSIKGEKKNILAELNKQLKAQQRSLEKEKKESKQAAAVWQGAQDKLDDWLVRNKAFADYVQELRKLETEIANANLAIAKCPNATLATDQIERLKGLGTQLAEDVKKAKAVKDELQLLVSECEVSVRQLLAERAEAQSRAKAITAAAEVKAEAEVLKAAYAILGALQSELVNSAVAPLIETCNKLCGNILVAPLIYQDGKIGMLRNGKFVAHRTFSGTEKALSYAALSIALASNAPLKLVILDEMGRLDAANKAIVLLRLVQLVKEKVIDQAVCVDTIKPDFNHELFKVIELTK